MDSETREEVLAAKAALEFMDTMLLLINSAKRSNNIEDMKEIFAEAHQDLADARGKFKVHTQKALAIKELED